MAEKTNNPEKKGRKNKALARAVTAIAAVVAAAGVFTAVCTAMLPKDTIVNGVKAEGIDLGGMTLGEAVDTIGAGDIYKNSSFVITSGGLSRRISADEVDLTVDVNATAQRAFDVCKSKNKLADAFKSLKLRFSTEEIHPVPSLNGEKLDAILYEFGKQINGELTENSVQISEDKAVITPGTAGQGADVSKERDEVINALAGGKEEINLHIEKQKPQEFNADSLIQAVHRDAQNAQYALENGKAVVKPHIVGVDADPKQAKEAAQKVNGGSQAEIAITRSMPEITEDMLKSKLYTGTLASYSTRYNKGVVNRSKNVELAASRINGTVLLPGDVFSYNGVVGARTYENGFKNAPVYENGKSVDGIGGGVCQVSTTLYSAVLYADLEIVKRQNHSLTVSYVPLGQDATVVDGAIDFQFKNNMDTPVRIDAAAANGSINISLVGTPVSGKSVKITHETTSTKEPTEKITNDPSLPEGVRKITSKGKNGYTVRSTKIIYQDGKEISRNSLGNSTYKMVQTEVSVGTGAQNAAAPSSAPAASKPVAEKPASEKPAPAAATPKPAEEKPAASDNTAAVSRPSANPTEGE